MSTRIGRDQLFERSEVRGKWSMTSAMAYLRQFQGDPEAMRLLRGVASRRMLDGGGDPIEQVAKMLVSGDLVMTVPKAMAPPGGQMPVAGPVREAVRRVAKEAPVLAELATFTENLHPVLLAASLQQASDEGVPFCEVCERMRKRGAA